MQINQQSFVFIKKPAMNYILEMLILILET